MRVSLRDWSDEAAAVRRPERLELGDGVVVGPLRGHRGREPPRGIGVAALLE
jgi:hypothetical protein